MEIETGSFGPFPIYSGYPPEWTMAFAAKVRLFWDDAALAQRNAFTVFLFNEVGAVNIDWFRVYHFDSEPPYVDLYFSTLTQALHFKLRWCGT